MLLLQRDFFKELLRVGFVVFVVTEDSDIKQFVRLPILLWIKVFSFLQRDSETVPARYLLAYLTHIECWLNWKQVCWILNLCKYQWRVTAAWVMFQAKIYVIERITRYL